MGEYATERRLAAEKASGVPWCGHCGEFPAVCMGRHDLSDGPFVFACGNCCGHYNDDGWCARLDNGKELLGMLNEFVARAEGAVTRRTVDTPEDDDGMRWCGNCLRPLKQVQEAKYEHPGEPCDRVDRRSAKEGT